MVVIILVGWMTTDRGLENEEGGVENRDEVEERMEQIVCLHGGWRKKLKERKLLDGFRNSSFWGDRELEQGRKKGARLPTASSTLVSPLKTKKGSLLNG